ncbi:MAG: ubiquinone biosynthesis protein COQ7 [Xenococcaceae cyanobacterium]
MRIPHSYQELLIHREHYVQLLRSGQVKPQARHLIRLQISKLNRAIDKYWPGWRTASAF